MVVCGQFGRGKGPTPVPLDGKSALARWLNFASLRSGRLVVVVEESEPKARLVLSLDEMAGRERLDLSAHDGVIDPLDLSAHDGVIDPLAFGPPAPSSPSGDTAGEW